MLPLQQYAEARDNLKVASSSSINIPIEMEKTSVGDDLSQSLPLMPAGTADSRWQDNNGQLREDLRNGILVNG